MPQETPFEKLESKQSIIFHTSVKLRTFSLATSKYNEEPHTAILGKEYKVIGLRMHLNARVPQIIPQTGEQAKDRQGNPVFVKNEAFGFTDMAIQIDENTGAEIGTTIVKEGFATLVTTE